MRRALVATLLGIASMVPGLARAWCLGAGRSDAAPGAKGKRGKKVTIEQVEADGAAEEATQQAGLF